MNENTKYTPEILLAMSNAATREKIKAMTIELVRTTVALTKKDIASWRSAWQMAIVADNPQRYRLYDVYDDVAIDNHLSGAVDQRKGMVIQKPFKLVDKSGKESSGVTKMFETEWFRDFVDYTLDSIYYGHSLVQFGDVFTVDGVRRFREVELVPRRHVMPEYGLLLRNVGDDPRRGIPYTTGSIADWCIEAGGRKKLGLLHKVSPSAISKKNMLAFWDSFGELFGMPIRIGKTISRDKTEISKVESMLKDMGAASWGLFPEGTEIEIKETSRGDAFNVYDKRIDRANSEMSKCLLTQTMTIDNGSSHSQSEVHLEVFKNTVQSDADYLRHIINNRLLPLMAKHGFGVEGYRFEYESITSMEVEQMLLSSGYDIDPEYFAQKYNLPVTGRRQSFFA